MCLFVGTSKWRGRLRRAFFPFRVYKYATISLKEGTLWGHYQMGHQYKSTIMEDVTPRLEKTNEGYYIVERGLHAIKDRSFLHDPVCVMFGIAGLKYATVLMECTVPFWARYIKRKSQLVTNKLVINHVYISASLYASLTDEAKEQLNKTWNIRVRSVAVLNAMCGRD